VFGYYKRLTPDAGIITHKKYKKTGPGRAGRLFIISSLLAWTTSVEVGLFMFTPNLMMLASLNSFFGMCQKYKIKKRNKFLILSVGRVFDLFVYGGSSWRK
jgi:hypothetical protein